MTTTSRHHVRIFGRGETDMIFAHGYGCDQNMWRLLTPRFEERYRIIVYDLLGAGQSDLSAYDKDKYDTLHGHASDLLEIIAEHARGPVVFVGHSVSAMIGMLASIKEPSRFSAQVMVGPSPSYINDGDYVGGFSAADIASLIDTIDSNYLGWAGAMAPAIMGAPDQPELGAELANSFCRTDPEIAKHFARVTFTSDHRADLVRSAVPSLIVQCSDDIIAPLSVGTYMQATLPNSTLRVIENIGHCPHLSAPQIVADAIRAVPSRVNVPYELAACGLLTSDAKGHIQQVNGTLCRFLGYTADALCERRFQDLLTVGSKLFHHTQWMPLLQMQGSIAEVQLEMVTSDGRIVPVLVNAANRTSDANPLVDIAILVASDRRKYERQLVDARKRAEELLVSERHAQAAAAVASRRLESFVLGAPTAIAVMTGPDHTFEIVNERFQALLRGTSAIGRPAREVLRLEESSKLWSLISRTCATGETTTLSDYVSELDPAGREGNKASHLDVVVQATLDAKGARNGVILYIVDVTQRVLDRLQLEEKNRELDSVASVASHDLKTPLRALSSLVTWVKEDDGERLSEQSNANLDLMLERIGRMNALIDGILRFARAGVVKDVMVDVPVRELVLQVVDMLGPSPSVRVELEEPMPTVHTSRVALEQVLLNLLSNALRFVPRTDGLVRVAATERGDRLVISVADNGPGIAPEHRERIWNVFQRLVAPEQGGGTGLGLAIVRKVVEARGGKVWIESQLGAGATFFFTWPIGNPDRPQGDPAS